MGKRWVVKGCVLIIVCLVLYACKKEQTASDKELHDYKALIVPEALARKVAQRIRSDYFVRRNPAIRSAEFPIAEREIVNSFALRDEHDSIALYVYNYNDSGFVVLSAEWQHEPICAFAERGKIMEYDSVPGMLVEWFSKTVENIQLVRECAYDNKDRANLAWCELIKETGLSAYPGIAKIKPEEPPSGCNSDWSLTTVRPLIPVSWGQGCSYNDLCPDKSCPSVCPGQRNAWTGCVATAIAQIIRYWQHGNRYQYNYMSMPETFGNHEVQRLMSDAGHDVATNYNCVGSAADCARIPNALKGSPVFNLPGFGFSSAEKSTYTSGSYQTIKDNLSNGWPVILDGCAGRKKVWLFYWKYSDCHDWVCDGYQSSQNNCYSYLWFHMNWGWHETWGNTDYNGWYVFNNWYVPDRKLNYQYAQDFVYNIY